jgi:adenosylcobyric acid synthase
MMIEDTVESGVGTVAGLGLLPVVTRFAAVKTLRRSCGFAGEVPVAGYEIHHGIVETQDGRAWFTSRPGGGGRPLDGCQAGAVSGTLWHGIFENDAFRRDFLMQTVTVTGLDFTPAAGTSFAAARQNQFDTLADTVDATIDTGALMQLIENGPASDLVTLRPGR